MKVVVGSVVKGFALKSAIVQWLGENGYEVIDVGVYDTDTFVKFPSVAERAAYVLQQGDVECAILCCGSGAGMSLAANKFHDVCAVPCESPLAAEFARKVNDANCLCMGESLVAPEVGKRMVEVFLTARFQDAAGVPQPVLDFWGEAADDIIADGDTAADVEMETLD